MAPTGTTSPGTARPTLPLRRKLAFAWLAVLLSSVLAAAAGELALRIVFRDGGRTTLGGPGGHEFDYTYRDAVTQARGPAAHGPKRSGVARVMLQGDSITYGIGVRNWRSLYPAQLLATLNADGERYELDTYAYPGKNIDGHLHTLAEVAPGTNPDIVIYQWYVNDLEIGAPPRPGRHWWQQTRCHPWLKRHSYLYYFVDNRITQFVPPKGARYPAQLVAEFGPGSEGWARFRDQFHRWALIATAGSRRALVCLYPQVPFRGTSPLAPINDGMRALAGESVLPYPAVLWRRTTGAWQETPDASCGRAWRWTGDGRTPLSSPVVPLAPGHYEVDLRLELETHVDGILAVRTRVGASAPRVHEFRADFFEPARQFAHARIPLDVEGDAPVGVQWEIVAPPGAVVLLDGLTVPVRYPRLSVLDLTDALTGFDTHASIFDAHPNAHAHRVIADRLAAWVRGH